VGRAAFDETAIRALEDQHPGVEFDWPRIPCDASSGGSPGAGTPRRSESETRRTVRHTTSAAAGCLRAA
jgi:hypothetical protein